MFWRRKKCSAGRHLRRSHFLKPLGERLEPRLLLATIDWDAGGDGTSWIDPLNWSTDTLPGAEDQVRIRTRPNNEPIVLSSDVTVQHVEIGRLNTCTSLPDLEITGATLTAAGGLDMHRCSDLFLQNSTILGDVFNDGRLIARGTSRIAGNFTQEDNLNIEAHADFGAATLTVDTSFTNNGFLSMRNEAETPLNATLIIPNGTLINNDFMELEDDRGGERNLEASLVNNDFLEVEEDVTITGDLTNNDFISLRKFGVLNVTGNFTQTGSDGFLSFRIGGEEPGNGLPQLNVTGSATLGGRLGLNDDGSDSAPPANGQLVTIANFASKSGSFERIFAEVEDDLVYTVLVNDTNIQLQAPVLADLIVESVSIPGNLTPHQPFEISWTVRNQGPDSNDDSWNDRVFFSRDDKHDNSDRTLLNVSFRDDPLFADDTYNLSGTFELRAEDVGEGFILVVVDESNRQFESNEFNNVSATPVTVSPPNVDFEIVNFSGPTEPIVGGEMFDVSWTVRNAGSAASVASSWFDSVTVATEPAEDSILRFLATQSITENSIDPFPLAPGGTYTFTRSVSTFNVGPGDFHLLIQADRNNNHAELDEDNNVATLPITILAPDLQAISLTAPEGAVVGGEIALNWSAQNISQLPAPGNWSDAFYLSSDQTLNPQEDRFIGSLGAPPESPLAPGATYNLARDLVVPASVAPGEQFLLLRANVNLNQPETDESNNVVGVPISLLAPDLEIFDTVSPESVPLGEQVSISWKVRNAGDVPALASSWHDRVYLSDDNVFDNTDQQVAFSTISDQLPLEPGAEYLIETTANIQANGQPGDFFLLFRTDAFGSQSETNEDNNTVAVPFRIDAPDLTVTMIEAPQTVTVGSQLLVSWTIENRGTVPALADWRDRVYVSTDEVLDNNDRQLASVSTGSFTPLAADDSYTFNQNLFFSGNLPLGNQFLLVQTDSDFRQGETDEDNNVLTLPIELVGTDLELTEFNAPEEAIVSEVVNFSWTVNNVGDAAALGGWSDGVYFSEDNVWDPSDEFLTSRNPNPPVGLAGSYTLSTSTFLDPDEVKPGEHFFILKVDTFEALSETDETNNIIVRPVTLNAPDMVVTDHTPITTVNVGEAFDFTWTVQNQGQFPTADEDWRDRLFLSRDNRLSSSDEEIMSFRVDSPILPLAPGASYTQTETVVADEFIRGTQFLLFALDERNDQGETDETNNLVVMPITLTAPDLVVTEIVAPDSAVVGSDIEVSWTVRNDGTGAAVLEWNDRVFITEEPDCESECDELQLDFVQSTEVGTLAVGASYTHTRTITIPQVGEAGPRALTFIPDFNNHQRELDDENRAAVAIELLPDDVDLQISEATGPATAVAGEQFEISWTVNNAGTAAAPNDWRDRVYISDDNVFHSNDIEVTSFFAGNHTPLAGGAGYTETRNVTIPGNASPGEKFLLFVTDADRQQAETNDENNVVARAFELQAPNLTISDPVVPATASPLETIQISYTVTNTGQVDASANWTDRVYVSFNDRFDTNDVLAASISTSSVTRPLAVDESYTITHDVTIPSDVGNRPFLLILTDALGEQSETNEEDNILAVPMTFPPPDLVVTAATAPGSAIGGRQVEISWTVTNEGVGTAFADFFDRVYISSSPFSNTILLRSRFISEETPLAPGESYTRTEMVTIPSLNAGTNFLRITTDYGDFRSPARQPESNNGNNTFVLPIDLTTADLDVTTATAPESVALGETVSVGWTVQNVGGSDATQLWRDGIYVSTDTVLDGADTFVASFSQPPVSPLEPNATYSATQDITIPSTADGERFLLFVADSNDGQAETDETNNVHSVPITIQPADLEMIAASTPVDTLLVNSDVPVSYTAQNVATTTLNADWVDRIYLSTDAVLDQGDRQLRNEPIQEQTPLAPDATYTVDTTVRIPGVTSGSYFLLFEGNANRGQPESDLTNNVFALPVTLIAPNLVPTALTAPAEAVVSETINVTYTVQNTGDQEALSTWRDRIYLSDDTTFDSGDRFLKELSIVDQSPLAPDADYTVETSFKLPNDLFGARFLLLVANAGEEQGETDRADNVFSTALQIAGPPNLIVSELTGPDTAAAGETITLNYTVTNTGDSRAVADWNDRFELAVQDGGGSSHFLDDVRIVDQSPLEPDGTYTLAVEVTLPQVVGERFLVAEVNASREQGETDTSDNRLFRPISIVAPDLVISSPLAPAEGVLGQSIAVSYTVTNEGSVPAFGNWSDRVYLSEDQTLDGNDVPVGNPLAAPTTLLPDESYTVSQQLSLPRFAIGEQFLLFQTDRSDNQRETNEDNNVSEAVPITLRASDLVVSNVTVPERALSGGAFLVSWTVTNQGDAVASNWTDQLFLSPDNVIGSDSPRGTFLFPGTLAPGESVVRTQGITPPIELEGERFVVVAADSASNVIESNEENNRAISDTSVLIELPPIPNLQVTEITTNATEKQLFEQFEVNWVVSNTGTGATNASFWKDTVYLSVDETLDGTDIKLKEVLNTAYLNAGESYANSAVVRAAGVSEGDFFLLVQTDSLRNVQEHFHEGDNVSVGPTIRITLPPPPDLVVTNVVAPEFAFSGQTMNLSWTVANQGDATAFSPWRDDVYMSADDVLDANDRFLGSFHHVAQYQVLRTVSFEGDYEACFGEPAPEPETSVIFSSTNLSTSVSVLQNHIVHDRDFTVCAFSNQATVRQVHRYELDTIESFLTPGDQYQRNQVVRLPVGVSGPFHFFVLTDARNQVNEFAFDNNNENFDQPATTVNLTPPPDLEVASLTVPPAAESGQPITVQYRVENRGSTRTPNTSWTDSFYLSEDDQLDVAEDTLLGNRRIRFFRTDSNPLGGLDADGAYSPQVTLTMPNGLTGDFFLFAVTDRPNDVFEVDDDNNASSAQPVAVTLNAPDLVVTAVSSDATVRAGDALTVQWTVQNVGTGPTLTSNWHDTIYVSQDEIVGNGDDFLLKSFPHVGRLVADASYDVTVTVPVPFDLFGNLQLYVLTDQLNQVAEFAGEGNNASTFVPLEVTQETADLAGTAVNLAAENGRVRIAFEVRNIGVNRTNERSWRDAIYVSPNETFGDGDDRFLTNVYHSGRLIPDQGYAVDRTFNIPFDWNQDFHFFLSVDDRDAIRESGSESNNVVLLGQLDTSTLRTFPDLVVHAVDAPAEVISGQFFDVTWTVRNVGDPIATTGTLPPEYRSTFWSDAVYLSRDQVFDAGVDLFLGAPSVSRTQLIDVVEDDVTLQEYSRTSSFRVPDGITGPLFVIVRADRRNEIIEIGAEDNNVGLDRGEMFSSLAQVSDLVVGTVSIPEDTALGSFVALTYSLQNNGENRVAGRWNDRLYLSTDDQFSVDDVSLGLAFHSFTVIPPGESADFEFTRSLPAVLPGDYHIVLRTDVFNAIPESNELNNLGASLETFRIGVDTIPIVDGSGSREVELDVFNQSTRRLYFQFDAQAGQTIALDAVGIENEPDVDRRAVTTAYVAFGRVPTEFDFDFQERDLLRSSGNNFSADRLVVPRTEEGSYFIRLDVRDTHFRFFQDLMSSHEHFNLELTVLPFSIVNVEPAVIGNIGSTTLDISASNFNVCSTAELLRDGEVVRTTNDIRLQSSSEAFVRFDFADLPPGTYEVRLADHDGRTATFPVEVVAGVGSRVDSSVRGPRRVRAGVEYVFYANYGNNGDSDGVAPLLIIRNLDNNSFSLNRSGLGSEPIPEGTVIQALGISHNGAAGVLRPDQLGSVPIFFRAGGTRGVAVGRFRVETVTAADERPFEIDAVEADLRPANVTDAEWLEIRPKLLDRIGPTWGTYVRTLAEVATSLADNAGVRTQNTSIVLRELVRQVREPNVIGVQGHVFAGAACDPVSSPEVTAFAKDGTRFRAFSDPTGRFSINAIEPGNYQLMVDAAGFARTVLPDVVISSETLDLDIELHPEARIAGSISLANNVPNTGLLAVSAVLDGAESGLAFFPASTLGPGFEITGLPGGSYDVRIELPGYTSRDLQVEVEAGATVDLGNLELSPEAVIAGIVVSETESFAVTDAVVGVFANDILLQGSEVDDAGNFAVNALAAGTYVLEVTNVIDGISSSTEVTVETGELLENVQLTISPGGTIAGTVRHAVTDEPLTTVPVSLTGPGGYARRVFTDEFGQYRFPHLNIGQYYVALPGATNSASSAVSVDSIDGSEFSADLSVAPAAQIEGTVTDASGNPIIGARVQLLADGQSAMETLSDEAGDYRFLLAAAGEFELLASVDGASFAQVSGIVVAADETVEANLQAGTASLAVNVTGSSMDAASDFIFLFHQAAGERLLAGSAYIGASGSVVFPNLVAGDYEVRIASLTGAGVTGTVSLDAGEQASLDLVMVERASVAVQVLDSEQEPVSNARMILYQGAQQVSLGISRADGTFRFPGVDPGTYDLVIFADGYRAQVVSEVTVTNSTIDQTITLIDSDSSVEGRIVGPNALPVGEGVVEALNADGQLIGFAEIQADGTFRITSAIGEDVSLRVRVVGSAVATVAIPEIAPSANVQLDDVVVTPLALNQGDGRLPPPEQPPTQPQDPVIPNAPGPAMAGSNVQFAFAPAPSNNSTSNNSTSYVSSITSGIIGYTFGEGDFQRNEALEVDHDAIPDLPDDCNGCASLRNQTVVAVNAQGIYAEIGDMIDEDIYYQRLIVVGIFGLEVTALVGSVAALIVAGAELVAAVGAATAAGATTAAVGTAATSVSGVSVAYAVAQVFQAALAINDAVGNMVSAPDTASAVSAADDIESGFLNLNQLTNSAAGLLDTFTSTGTNATGVAIPGLDAIGAIFNILDFITFTSTREALGLLGELEASLENAKMNYDQSHITAFDKLMQYIACIAFPEDCENGPGSDNGGSDGDDGGDDGDGDGNDGPNPPSPPPTPDPPTPYDPELIQSQDPNDIIGPDGFGEEGWIGVQDTLPYMIRFENVAEASAPAQRVTITQQLDEDLDPRTFRVDDFGFGDQRIEIDGTLPFFQGRVELPNESGNVVDVIATVDVEAGILTWIFQTINPLTGDVPVDALAGFLPPNDPKGVGEGFVTYTIRGRRNATSGTRVDATATIIFDTNEEIDTPDIFNTLDVVPPTSQVEELPDTVPEGEILIQWSGEDDEAGSGIADFTIFVATDGGPPEVWLQDTELDEALWAAEVGHTYAFTSVARDHGGNVEALPAEPDAVIFIGQLAEIRGIVWIDGNGDGIRDDQETRGEAVTVDLLDANGERQLSTTTNELGEYRFEDVVPQQEYFVEVLPTGGTVFSSANQGDNDEIDSDLDPDTGRSEVLVPLSGEVVAIDAGLLPLGSISGDVWVDRDGSGTREDEAGLIGRTVFLDLNNNSQLDENEPRRLTDGEGSYVFDELLPDTYFVLQIVPEDSIQTFPTTSPAHVVELSVGEDRGGVDFGVVSVADVSVSHSTLVDPIVAGQPLTVEVQVTNLGPAEATLLQVTNDVTLAVGVELAAAVTSQGAINPETLVWDVGTLPVDGIATLTLTFDVATQAADGAQLSFAAALSNVEELDRNADNDQSSVTTSIITFDFGDAPDVLGLTDYRTLFANDGARHRVTSEGPFLGDVPPDVDADGQSSASAQGDDLSDDDEDGVLFGKLTPGNDATITVTVSGMGKLDAFVDWNRDGDFADDGETILDSVIVGGGARDFTITVPAEARQGATYARFRVSTAGDLSFDGAAADGEVEDYRVEVGLGLDVPALRVGENTVQIFGASPGATVLLVQGTQAGETVLDTFGVTANIAQAVVSAEVVVDEAGNATASVSIPRPLTRHTVLFQAIQVEPAVVSDVAPSAVPLRAADGTGPGADNLNTSELAAIVEASLAQWRQSSLTQEQLAMLDAVIFSVADLPGDQLATALGQRVVIDADAGGFGWFVDVEATAFEEEVGGVALRATGGVAAQRIDLLTAVSHQIGHLLGLNDTTAAAVPDHLMIGALPIGMRRLPIHYVNLRDSGDANDDGFVNPTDVLFIVNTLNGINIWSPNGKPQVQTAGGELLTAFLDITNDFLLTPFDVLFLINRLNQGDTGAPEGEFAVTPQLTRPNNELTSFEIQTLPALPASTSPAHPAAARHQVFVDELEEDWLSKPEDEELFDAIDALEEELIDQALLALDLP